MTTGPDRPSLKDRLDLVIPWLVVGLGAGALTHWILAPVTTPLEWIIIFSVSLAVLLGLWLLFRHMMNRVTRRADELAAEHEPLDRFVDSLSIDAARTLCYALLEQGELRAIPAEDTDPPLPMRLTGATRALFEEFREIANSHGLTLSRDAIRDDDDTPTHLIVGDSADGHGYIRFEPVTANLHLIYEGEPEGPWDSPWHLILIETIKPKDIERLRKHLP